MPFDKKPRKMDEFLLAQVRQKRCCVCGISGPCDPSHIRSRGSGGPDEPWNVVPMCRVCHALWHNIGWVKFLQRNPIFTVTLLRLGWDWEDGKLWHPGLL